MKRLFGLAALLLVPTMLGAQESAEWILNQAYASHPTVCTATAVDSTNANQVGPLTAGKSYLIYGYVSATDFTGVAIKCLQGNSSVTVNAKAGVKFTAGEKQIWYITNDYKYISCQTGSGTGFYDVCVNN